MLCLKFCRSVRPCTTDGLLPPIAALSRIATPEISGFKSLEQSWNIFRPVIVKRCLSCVPQPRSPLSVNQFQGRSAHHIKRTGVCPQLGLARSAFLPSRLSPLKILRFSHESAFNPTLYATKSSIRQHLKHKMSNLRTRATAHDPIAILLQPLDSSCHYQSVKRGFAISLPILIIYLLIYLLNIVPWESKLGQQYRGTVTRFWAYRRQEGFDNIANLCTYVTSQFTHGGLIPLVLDSLVLIGVASILGLVFNRRTFFAVYVLGGFLAAAADCTWARITNPCRCITQAELDQNLTFARLINEALHKKAEIIASSQLFTMRGFVRLLTNTGELSWTAEELDKQNKVIKTYYPQTRDWDRWIMQNYAASGSLACLCMPTPAWESASFLFHAIRHYSDADVRNI